MRAPGVRSRVVEESRTMLTRRRFAAGETILREHDIGEVAYIIEKGRVVWTGDSEALRADEEAQHRYLGV